MIYAKIRHDITFGRSVFSILEVKNGGKQKKKYLHSGRVTHSIFDMKKTIHAIYFLRAEIHFIRMLMTIYFIVNIDANIYNT